MSDDILFPSDDQVPAFYLDEPNARTKPDIDEPPTPAQGSDRRYRPGFAWLAWIVIVGCTGLIVWVVFVSQFVATSRKFDKTELYEPIRLGKLAVGAVELGLFSRDDFQRQLKNSGPFQVRYCHAILVNELWGPAEALEYLQEIDDLAAEAGVQPDDKQARMQRILNTLFLDYRQERWQARVSSEDREFLQSELAWCGRLAFAPKHAPPNEARQEIERRATNTVYFFVSLVVGLILLAVIGLAALLAYLILFLKDALVSRVADQSMNGPIYAETFAVWMLLFLLGSILASLPAVQQLNMPALPLVFTLLALLWPRLRGVPWDQVREDIGLYARNPLAEVAAGITAYISMIPILAVGLIIVALISNQLDQLMPRANEFTPRGTGGSHPIINEVFSQTSWTAMLKIYVLTVVIAPLVEETIFRGVLFRHLRDATSRLGRWTSVATASLLNALIFALIHPQGLIVALPLLVPLAFGFSLARQWRGSLIAPITMHAIHNFLATLVLLPMVI